MKTAAIIQARMGATRLPGKVLRPLAGRSVLGHVLARVAACSRLDAVIVATTDKPADDGVAAESRRWGADCFRGSEEDVLARYYFAAQENRVDVIIRITADCPLYDSAVLDRMLARFREDPQTDYLSNVIKRTLPRGLDTEIFTFAALARAHGEARQPYEREHVTPYFYQHPDRFRLGSYEEEPDRSALRWTLDTPEDWAFIEAMYAALYRDDSVFGTAEVLKLLKDRPELGRLNAHVEQKKLGG